MSDFIDDIGKLLTERDTAVADAKASEMMLKQVCGERDDFKQKWLDHTGELRSELVKRSDMLIQALGERDKYKELWQEVLGPAERHAENSAYYQVQAVKLREQLKQACDEREGHKRTLEYISETLCGVKVEGEVKHDMVSMFVEGQIDKQAALRSEAEEDASELRGKLLLSHDAHHAADLEVTTLRGLLRDCPLLDPLFCDATPTLEWIERAREEALKL